MGKRLSPADIARCRRDGPHLGAAERTVHGEAAARFIRTANREEPLL
jgi:hypothetical protein